MANLLKRSCFLQSLVRIGSKRAGVAVAAAAANSDNTLWMRYSSRIFLGTASAFPSTFAKPVSSTALSEPWLMLPPDNDGMSYKFYTLAKGQVISVNKLKGETDDHCVGSSHGWLAYVSSHDCSFYLLNPLSSSHHKKELPSLETLPFIKGTIRDPKTSIIRGFLVSNNSNRLSYFITPQDLCKSVIDMLVLSCQDIEGENCIAFIVYRGHLAFCRPSCDTSWTLLHSPLEDSPSHYLKIAYDARDGLFYTLTHRLELESWDLRDPASPKRCQIHNPFFGFEGTLLELPAKVSDVDEYFWRDLCIPKRYLVSDPSSGDILLVIRYVADGINENGEIIPHTKNLDGKLPYKTIAFDVFKLIDFTPSMVGSSESDDKDVILELLDSLGDRSLFIGPSHCFTLSTKDFPMLKPNYIYFTDDGTFSEDGMLSVGTYGGHDLGIYNYEDSHIEPCYFPIDVHSIRRILPVPIWYLPTTTR